MTRINFEMADFLIRQVDHAIDRKGFGSRSEFFRFLVIDYCEKNGFFKPNGAHVPSSGEAVGRGIGYVGADLAEDSVASMSSRENEIAEAERQLDAIVAEKGLEFGIPKEAVDLIYKLVQLKKPDDV